MPVAVKRMQGVRPGDAAVQVFREVTDIVVAYRACTRRLAETLGERRKNKPGGLPREQGDTVARYDKGHARRPNAAHALADQLYVEKNGI